MQKTFLLLAVILLYSQVSAYCAYGDSQYAAPVAQNPAPASAPAPSDNSTGVDLNSPDMEKIIKAQEVILRKIKAQHVRQGRKKHVLNTENFYQEAKSLYHQKRPAKAKKVFAKVEDSMADYKRTNLYLRVIDDRAIEQLRQRMRRIREMQGTQLVVNLAQKASMISQKAEALGNDQNFAPVRDKLNRVKEVLERIKREKIAASQETTEQLRLDQMANEADNFDQEVSKLVAAKDYVAAKKKYEEFQQAMADELVRVKQNMARESRIKNAVKTQDNLFKEKGYRVQEEALFRQGIDLYKTKQYLEAKSIFDELASQGDERAKAYSRKIDRMIL